MQVPSLAMTTRRPPKDHHCLCVITHATAVRHPRQLPSPRAYTFQLLYMVIILLWSFLLDVRASIPDIVHQIYDYNSPNLFLYLSLQCVQFYMRPAKHILWINNEGKQRKQQWHHWLEKNSGPPTQAVGGSGGGWEANFTALFNAGKVEARFITFPYHPPGNESIFVTNKAHRSDFVRMQILQNMGGIYLDTDVFVTSATIHSLREHEFVLAVDNIVFPPKDRVPHKLNNGVIFSIPNASFLSIWQDKYKSFDPNLWDMHSSIVPYQLAMEYPDLIHLETHRISPFSFGFDTAKAAIALTCGILDIKNKSIWSPRYDIRSKSYTFEGAVPDKYVFHALSSKILFHLTMSQVRGICFMRKNLNDLRQVRELFPSFLGHILRMAVFAEDRYDYDSLLRSPGSAGDRERLGKWQNCRHEMGMHYAPEGDHNLQRHQYFSYNNAL